MTLEYFGLELNGSRRFGSDGPTVHFGAAFNELDMEFQVNALAFGFLDRTRLLADGSTVSLTAGATWAVRDKAHVGFEVFYSPLDVQRAGATSSEDDPLLNARALFRYKLR